jgi:glycosyltransferase involved in cell wall biosynthesis
MKLLIVADGRSPITRRWIHMLQPLDYEISLISTYPCSAVEGVNGMELLPVAFAGFSGSQAGGSGGSQASGRSRLVSQFRGMASGLRHWLGPSTIPLNRHKYLAILSRFKPDLVHALRIPFEGMLASLTPLEIPLIVSTWGNDLTFHAPSTLIMNHFTRAALRRADALMSDTLRDIRLAREWGFDAAQPTLNVVGNGGVDVAEIQQVTRGIELLDPPHVINPRGFRSGSVRNDTFFKSIPLVLQKYPQVQFICPWMANQREALAWVENLGIAENVTLLPMLSQVELWKEFARSTLSVSVSVHDGTPNSLLEAMSAGCLPVCGDIESIREWITNGENGLLVDPADPRALACAILRGIEDAVLRRNAASQNLEIIRSRAEVSQVRGKVSTFYQQIAGK